MAESSPESDNDIITSFSNPNYQLNHADLINSNVLDDNHIYEDPDIILDTTVSRTTNGTQAGDNTLASKSNIKDLIENDTNKDKMNLAATPGSVCSSVDMHSPHSGFDSAIMSPSDHLPTEIIAVEHTESHDEDDAEDVLPKGFLGYYASLEKSASINRLQEEAKQRTIMEEDESLDEKSPHSLDDKLQINSPDSGIQSDDTHSQGQPKELKECNKSEDEIEHVHGPVNDDIYAVVNPARKKKKSPGTEEQKSLIEAEEEDKKEDEDYVLPEGWKEEEDAQLGKYYWHVKSGITQQERPPPAPPGGTKSTSSSRPLSQHFQSPTLEARLAEALSGSKFNGHMKTPDSIPASGSNKLKQEEILNRLSKIRSEEAEPSHTSDQPIRFAVQSLGWVQIDEADLTQERSSRAVNKCIVDLSLGRNDINDVVGRWGDGKDLYMDLDSHNLTLIDPTDQTVLNLQPIQSIRVWGVGRDNGRDFAYVARDRATRRHMCHVFRSETPARQIANTLRDICNKINIERTNRALSRINVNRPKDLAISSNDGQKITFQNLYRSTSFPTPMEEPKKILRCHYLGTVQVKKPTGVEILNGAMEMVYAQVPPEKWMFVNVAVAPSTITVSEYKNEENVLAECRVRFLSFMGIAQRNVKLCAFIVHTADDTFVAHVFHSDPSAGALCKTIEAACKLRYQKCLDAHPLTPDSKLKSQQTTRSQTGSYLASLKAGAHNMFDKLKKRTGGNAGAQSPS